MNQQTRKLVADLIRSALGAALIGYGTGSWCVGIGVFLITEALAPTKEVRDEP